MISTANPNTTNETEKIIHKEITAIQKEHAASKVAFQSMMNKLKANQEAEDLLFNNRTQQILDKRQQLQELEDIFFDINQKIEVESKLSSGLNFEPLSAAIVAFKTELHNEILEKSDSIQPALATANELKQCIHTVFEGNDYNKKEKAITHFEQQARNSKLSARFKLCVGLIGGALLGLALGIGLMAIGILVPFPFILFIPGMMAIIAGPFIGCNIASSLSANQNDERGKIVTKELNSICTQKHRLFQAGKRQAKPQDAVIETDALLLYKHKLA